MTEGKLRMHKRGAAVLAAFLLLLLSGCGGEGSAGENDYLFSDGSMDAYLLQLDDYYSDFAVDGDKIYLANSEKTSVYSGADGELKEFLPTGGSAVEAFGKEVYLLNEDGIDVYDEAGNQKERYAIEENPNFRAQDLIVNEKWIVCWGFDENDSRMSHTVYRIDRETGGAEDISEGMRNGRTVYGITGMDFSGRDAVFASVKVTVEFLTEENIGQVYDLEKGQLAEELPLPHSAEVNAVGEDMYYERGGLAVVRRGRGEEAADTVVRAYDKEQFADLSGSDLGAGGWKMMGKRLCVTGKNIMYLFPMIHALYIDRLEYDNPPVRIIAEEGNRTAEYLGEAAAQFTARHHAAVEITELPRDGYSQKINLKLLAGDDDFDLYLLGDIDGSHVLLNILEKKAFQPLEGYPQTERIYGMLAEGLRDMHSYEGSVYALPWQWNYMPLTLNREVFERHHLDIPAQDWTFEDVWVLCDKIMEEKLDVRVFNNEMDFINYAVWAWCEKDYQDGGLLKGLLEKIRLYMNCGVLAYENGEPGQYNFNKDKDALFTTHSLYNLPYSGEENEAAFRHPVFEKGDGAYVQMQIAVLANKNSDNIDAALSFMEYAYDSSILYSWVVPADCRRDSVPSTMGRMISGSRPYIVNVGGVLREFNYTEVCDPGTDMEGLVEKIMKMVRYGVEG